MALTRLDNLYSSKTGKYLYVSPDDFNATDELDNRGNSPLRPFKTIQRAFIEVARYSFLPAVNGESVPDRFDQFSIMLMPGDHYIDNRPGLATLTSAGNEYQRYYNAKELIIANRQEIIDRSFAQIVIDYDESLWGTDWVVPGDEVLPNGSPDALRRGQSAYRLIQKNRDFIKARSVGELSIQYLESNAAFGTDWVIPGDSASDPEAQDFNKRAGAYRLILKNKNQIVDYAWTTMVTQYPDVAGTETKCKRDIGQYIEYLSLDVLFGGTKFTKEFMSTYLDAAQTSLIPNGIDGEKEESRVAFTVASQLMSGVITNAAHPDSDQLIQWDVTALAGISGVADVSSGWYYDDTLTADPAADGTNYDPNSCADARAAIATVAQLVDNSIQTENLDLFPETTEYSIGVGTGKCYRDAGFFVDAISLDVSLGGGNRYTRKYIENYFNPQGTGWVDNGLQGEEVQSGIVFNKARDLMQEAATNQLGYKDFTITHDPNPQSGDPGSGADYSPLSCAGVRLNISNLAQLVETYFNQGSLENFPEETTSTAEPGELKCKRDIGYLVDAVAADLPNGGNGSVINFAKAYFDKNGLPISNGLLGEEAQSVIAFNKAGDMMKKATTNQLYSKDLTILSGPAEYSGYETGQPTIPNLPSGNAATCIDVQANIDTLVSIATTVISEGDLSSLNDVPVTGDIPVFNYNAALEEWQDNSILDLSNPDNVLYKFNSPEGGAIVPRGCSLIGYDLRRTIVRPLYVPDPIDGEQERTSIFNLTGGCYLWQFTIKDGDLTPNSPLYDVNAGVGKVYYKSGNNTQLAIPEYSHHKITIMTYTDTSQLQIYYDKVARAFALFQPTIDDGDFEQLPQENRIVGPLSDTRSITNLTLSGQTVSGDTKIVATTKTAHGYFKDQYVAVIDNGLDDRLNGTFKVSQTFEEDPKKFEYIVETTPQQLGLDIGGVGYSVPDINVSARVQAEIDSVESASPYVFNCSIRSTWGQCGMWADGSKATGFKSMVVAQYTGVSLQKDDRAFIRYDEFSNTWNQASLQDAFASTAYHTKGDAYWKDDWKNFHIRASDDSFIQCVSVFAVGFFDHFLMESGGDMSITNSNSNFGNTSLHSIGYKGFAFNQDKGGYITDIVPVKSVDDSTFNVTTLKYFPLSNQATKVDGNQTKLYYSGDDVYSPFTKPATSIEGYRLGALTDEKVYLKMTKETGGTGIFHSTLSPTGFKRYSVSVETLNPDNVAINNNAQDAANLIEANKAFIQNEAYNYIITRYPEIQSRESITIEKCERDIGYIVDAIVQDLRIGGNVNTIQAAEGYYVGGTLSYIDGEFNESIEAYEYVRSLCIAAMRNWDILIRDVQTTANSPIVNVGDTSGLVVGMTVTQYDYNETNFTNGRLNYAGIGTTVFPTDAQTGNPVISGSTTTYIRRIIDSNYIELGNARPTLSIDADGLVQANLGVQINALITSPSGAYLHFTFPRTGSQTDDEDILDGGYSSLNAVRDSEVLQDTSVWDPQGSDVYPECAGIAQTITQDLFDQFFLILNNGLTPLGGTEVDAYNLITANRAFIIAESWNRAINDPNLVGYSSQIGEETIKAKLGEFIDAVAYNIKYGGVNKVYEALTNFVTSPGTWNGERTELRYFFIEANPLMRSAMKNEPITVFDVTVNDPQIGTPHGLTQYIDNRVLGDTSQQPGIYDFAVDCADVASTISTFGTYALSAIGDDSGITPTLSGMPQPTDPNYEPEFNVATRIEPTIDTANLAARATLFNVDTGDGGTDPHYFETGTPVRLVPRVRDGVPVENVDKRVIRLPKGFNTNQIYYVIAPGRTTQPEDYAASSTYPGVFDVQATTKLMLATTKENAAAGIYMYSPETESVNSDVQIDLYNYVLDESYKLHQYIGNFENGLSDVIYTDVPHIFDVPSSDGNVHKIFFSTFGDNSTLPQIAGGSGSTPIATNRYYYARYVTERSFAVFDTASDAIFGSPRITFDIGDGQTPTSQNFYVFANKRESPVKFDPTRDDSGLPEEDQETTTGQWYIQTTDDYDPLVNIQARMNEIGVDLKDDRSKNTTYQRLEDDRSALDRIYRLRYVIPKHADGVRDPLNGFVIKTRTDSTRKLVPQRIVLTKDDSSVGPSVARFFIPVSDGQGGTTQQQLGLTADQYTTAFSYDPYKSDSVKQVTSDRTVSGVAFSIQSARTVTENSEEKLELTVFDHTITDSSIKNEQFITVKIEQPQGGNGVFRSDSNQNVSTNKIFWNGFASGSGYVQGMFTVDDDQGNATEYYLVLKELEENNEERETVEYNPLVPTILYQNVLNDDGSVVLDSEGVALQIRAKLLAKQDSVGSANLSLAKSLKEDYLYSDKETNVFTMTPGDVITDDAGVNYKVTSVTDVGELEDTFYIFDVEEIKRRIPGQQEGIYYLTCVKGNVSPYPTGTGIGTNFRGFKFSQPISQLYPINYKNDPQWFKQLDSTFTDPPATICAADNFIHGLVTTNDYKNSVTKEVVQDLVNNPPFDRFTYTTNKIEAQPGPAASGAESRLIPICGDSPYPMEKRLYVELRRPSIARSGNHTFEYLGFGPGNYSTGFPLRQEVVLEDVQDFYAQAKREDGGIVFYTGLNSNGDLYIGNKKINAITGEETFLEKAELLESDDEDDDVGGLVTTFELPVVFEQEITVDGDALFNNPVEIAVDDEEPNALTIVSNIGANSGLDTSLDSGSFNRSSIASEGNIVLHQNQIFSGIFRLNPRGNDDLTGQDYSVRTHTDNSLASKPPTNRSPHQSNPNLGFSVKYGVSNVTLPIAGDVLLKGAEVGFTGSLGWIYSNFYTEFTSLVADIRKITDTVKTVRFNTNAVITGLDVGSVVKIEGLGTGTSPSTSRFDTLNGLRTVTAFVSGSWFEVEGPFPIVGNALEDSAGIAIDQSGAITISIASNAWKEVGVLGAEAIRTDTSSDGRYALGINTIARAPHSDHNSAWVSAVITPRATADVVGNMFISGMDLAAGNFDANPDPANRTFNVMDHAFMVGGNSLNSVTQAAQATFRVSTTTGSQGSHYGQTPNATRNYSGGRVGIEVPLADMNHTLTVGGDMRVSGRALLEDNLDVLGGAITTNKTSFDLLRNTVEDLNFVMYAKNIDIGNSLTDDDTQVFNLGTNAGNSTINLGSQLSPNSDGDNGVGIFNVHSSPNGVSSTVRIGTIGNESSDISTIQIGGAYANISDNIDTGSIFNVRNRFTNIDGDLTIGTAIPQVGTGVANFRSIAKEVNVLTLNTTKINFGLSASRLYVGAAGGFTQINNSLVVKNATTLEGDTTLLGGLNSGLFEVTRGSYGTEMPAHAQGDIDLPNVDLFVKQSIGRQIDTDGAGFWGGIDYKVPNSADDKYYLTISAPSDTNIFEVGAYLLIDRSVEAEDADGNSTQGDAPIGQEYSELVLIEELTNLNTIGDEALRVLVSRARNQLTADGEMILGTPANLPASAGNPSPDPDDTNNVYKYLRNDHPDNVKIIRYNLSVGVSFIDQTNGLPAQTYSGSINPGIPDVNINTGEFSGSVKEGDILRFTSTELALITEIASTSNQRFLVTDGNLSSPVEQFFVDSVTGEVSIAGTTTFNDTITFIGSTAEDSKQIIVTDGTTNETLVIDSATGSLNLDGDFGCGTWNDGDYSGTTDRLTVKASSGDTTLRGGNLKVTTNDSGNTRLLLNNDSGDLTLFGNVFTDGPGTNTFQGDLTINGGNFIVNSTPDGIPWQPNTAFTLNSIIYYGINMYTVTGITGSGNAAQSGSSEPVHINGDAANGGLTLTYLKKRDPVNRFEIESDGRMNFAGQEGFFTPSGARKWTYVGSGESELSALPNYNYFVSPAAGSGAGLVVKLPPPEQCTTGDMIRFVDVGGNLTYNNSLVLRAYDDEAVQGDVTNANIPDLTADSYNGGELVVQTPNAAFGVIYLGAQNYDGTSTGAGASVRGWWLMEI